MRHVISKEEVAAAWVSMDRDHAKTPTRNFWFNSEDELYSYSTCIASRIETPKGKARKTVMFITTHNYSVTTNAQLAELNNVVRHITNHVDVMYVPYDVPTSINQIHTTWKNLADEVRHYWDKSTRAKARKLDYLYEGNNAMKRANKLVELFGHKITKGIKASTIKQMQEEMRIIDAMLELRA